MTKRRILACIALTLMATGARTQEPPAPAEDTAAARDTGTLLQRFSDDPDRFTQTDGEALYRTTCQACHMEDGRGDAGAGAHPPLADNPKVASKHFVAGVVMTGYHGMPRFGHQMSDDQVAEVTNYVRSSFGNDHSDPITPDEVADLRAPEDND